METKKLIQLLAMQIQNLDSLKKVMIQQQKAIVKNEISAIELAAENEEIILGKIRINERQRIAEIAELSKVNDFNLESFSLSELLKAIKENHSEEYDTLFRLRNQIVLLAYEVNNINNQNSFLIDHARQFIKETITTLYGANQRQIFDRKI